MRRMITIGLSLGALAIAPAAAAAPDPIIAAIAAPDRPVEDTARDADRKPASILAFTGAKPGDIIADVMPGKGYFTRLFAHVAGAKGKVYAVMPAQLLQVMPKMADPIKAVAALPAYANVTVITRPTDAITLPQPVDVAFTAQNYHDIYGFYGADAAAAFDRAVFAMLKPGGVFVVEDHSALADTSATSPTKLHRIDEAVVKAQVLAAGFVLEATSDALRNPADPRDLPVFAPSLRGHTDQFVLKFRKPA